ncbi:hypothetical protein, partial [Deinococcus sp. DB0503]|uniref:hypothetical protein n=1 Tax=Deinococcus sp. DB0503 TaxID=2479203 RepID=UPI001E56EB4B
MTADLTTVKDGRLQVHMHPGQARAIQSKARHVLVLAGLQTTLSHEPLISRLPFIGSIVCRAMTGIAQSNQVRLAV